MITRAPLGTAGASSTPPAFSTPPGGPTPTLTPTLEALAAFAALELEQLRARQAHADQAARRRRRHFHFKVPAGVRVTGFTEWWPE